MTFKLWFGNDNGYCFKKTMFILDIHVDITENLLLCCCCSYMELQSHMDEPMITSSK